MNFKKMLTLALLVAAPALGDTPVPRVGKQELQFNGEPITATQVSSQLGLDCNVINPNSSPIPQVPVWLGAPIDPRSIRPLTLSDQISCGQTGVWSIANITGSISLPTGASTSALQSAGNASLSSIDSKTPTLGQKASSGSSPVVIANDQSAIPVVVSGGATAANQTTGNSTLSSLDGKVRAFDADLGAGVQNVQGVMLRQSANGGSVEVGTVANPLQVAVQAGGSSNVVVTSSALPTGASTSTLQSAGNGSLSSIDSKTPNLGQNVMAGSVPVAISSNQSAIPASQSGTWNINNVSGTVSLPTGASTSAAQATGNASLDSIDNKLNSLGQKASVGSVPVVIANDQSPITVTGSISATNPSVSGNASAIPGSSTLIGGSDAGTLRPVAVTSGGVLKVDGSATTQPVSIASQPLPTGASTEAKQDAGNASLSTINGKITNTSGGAIKTDGSAFVQPVSAASLPLPSGAATAAAQTTGNNSLSSIDGKLRAFDLDSGAGTQNVQGVSLRQSANGGSVEVGTAADPLRVDPTGSTTQPVSVSALPLPSGAATETTLSAVNSKLTNTSGGALKVDGSLFTQPVSIASQPLPTGASTESKQDAGNLSLSGINSKLTNTSGGALKTDGSSFTQPVSAASLPLPSGAATANKQDAGNSSLSNIDSKVVVSVNGILVDGSGVTQPVSASSLPLPTGAATSSLQTAGNSSLSSIDSKTPAKGQTTKSGSVPVTIASDQEPMSVKLQDSAGNGITSTTTMSGQALDVNLTGGNITLETSVADNSTSGSLSALNDTLPLMVSGVSGARAVIGGTWSGVIIFEATVDGSRWDPTGAFDALTGQFYATGVTANTQVILVGIAGSSGLRARMVSYTSGTATLTLNASTGSSNNFVASLTPENLRTQVYGSNLLQPIATDSSGKLQVDSISGAVSLPTGASTSALQTTGNSTLSSLDTKTPTLGQKSSANSSPVVIANDQSAIPASQSGTWNINNVSGTVSLPTGAATSSLQSTGNSTLSSIDTKTPTVGQKTSANSSPVVISSDQSAIPASQSGSWTVAATQSGTWNVNNISGTVSLPTGAATAANQATGNSSLSSLDGKTAAFDVDTGAGTQNVQGVVLRQAASGGSVEAGTATAPLRVDPTGTTPQPASQSGTWNINNVSGTVSLPTGAATSSLQTAGNVSLSSLDTKTPTQGQKVSNGSVPVVIASDQSAVPASQSGTWNINNISGTVSLPTGAATAANQTTGNSSLSSIDTKTPTVGQKTSANSSPVVLSSDQSAIPVTQGGAFNITNISGTVSLPTGAATESSLAKLTLSQGSTTSGQSGALVQGAVSTSAPAYTNGQTSPVSLTTAGAVRTDSSATTQPISAVSLPLPTGAATSSAQTTGNNSLSSIDSKTPALVTGRVPVDGSGVTQPISAAALPLPSGAATETTVSAINGKLNSLGQKASTGSVPVVIANDQSAVPVTPTTSATGSNQAKGRVDCSAITGTYATILTPSFNVSVLHIFNSCNGTIVISINGGTTDYLELEAGESTVIDLKSNYLFLGSGVNIQVKDGAVNATAGSLRISAAG